MTLSRPLAMSLLLLWCALLALVVRADAAPAGAAAEGKPVGLQGPVGCQDNPKKVERLEIEKPGVY
ncbi:MAG: hypothetical protein JNM56_02580, partial [Planctomycetia bacterium]|nr:hypothetical protein [Planctomycetia bacterium]